MALRPTLTNLLLTATALAVASPVPAAVADPTTPTPVVAPPATPEVDLEAGVPGPVVVWGDSLVWESTATIRRAFAERGWEPPAVRGRYGQALCRWVDEIRADLAAAPRPRALVLESYGNAVVGCAGAPDASDAPEDLAAHRAAYRRAFAAVAEAAAGHGVPVVFVTAPPRHPSQRTDQQASYAALAAGHGWTVLAAGGAVAAPDGTFTPDLPCLPSEEAMAGCAAGRIEVRHADLIHFDPPPAGDEEGYRAGSQRWVSAWVGGIEG